MLPEPESPARHSSQLRAYPAGHAPDYAPECFLPFLLRVVVARVVMRLCVKLIFEAVLDRQKARETAAMLDEDNARAELLEQLHDRL